MEEVDKIIIPILNQIGCNLPEKIENFALFEDVHVYAAAAAIMRAINPDNASQYPKALPPASAQAQRYRLTSSLCDAVKEMGFQGELGYQNFLYPNEADTRKLLIWLVDKLPKTESKDEEEAEEIGGDQRLQDTIAKNLKEWASQIWSPLNHVVTDAGNRLVTVPLDIPLGGLAKAREAYVKSLQPLVTRQPPQYKHFAPSLFEANALTYLDSVDELKDQDRDRDQATKKEELRTLIGNAFRGTIAKYRTHSIDDLTVFDGGFGGDFNSAFNRRKAYEQESAVQVQMVTESGSTQTVTSTGDVQVPESEDAIKEARDREIASLNAKLNELQEKYKKMLADTEAHAAAIHQTEGEFAALQRETKKLEEAYKLKKRTLDLLPNAEKNLEQLTQISADNSKRLLDLGAEWEKVRIPLVQKIRKTKREVEQRKGEVGTKVAEIKSMRADMKLKAQAVKEKDQIYKQVAEELASLPKTQQRQTYVRRIMDIVKNLDKQKVDIKKILVDVHKVQKDINAIQKTSTRAFALADEVVYQAAKNNREDPVAAQAYKNVVTMRDGFSALVEKVEETGRCKNEISDIRSRIEAIEQRNTTLNMERVQKDLEQVQKENRALATKLKALKQKLGAKSGGKDEDDA